MISLLSYNFIPQGLQRKSVWPHHQCFAEEGKTRLCMASPAEGWSQGKCGLIMCLKPSVHFANMFDNMPYVCYSLQPSWINVDFDNWRDWEHEEDEGKEEYDRYVDVSKAV